MKIENNTIIFKSTPENFHKEKEGLKSCTIRRIELWSEMKEVELFYNRWKGPGFSAHTQKVMIINTSTAESFERTLTDVSQFEGLWFFSWRAE